MKAISLLVCAACLFTGVSWARAAEPPPPIQLKGIVSFATNRFALLENVPPGSFQHELIFSEGKRYDRTEVVKIDVPSETVTIKQEGIIRELTFDDGLPMISGRPASLHLQKASLSQVF